MTRRLPWKRIRPPEAPTPERRITAAGDGAGSSSRAHTPASAGRTATWPRIKSDGTPPSGSPRVGEKAEHGHWFRSPSTSPPPAPPVESFMIAGMENDDQYRMVEDEFLSIAGLFTAHLHAAEYHRLKALAKSKNAGAIQEISRPVTGEMTAAVERGRQVMTKTRKQQAVLNIAGQIVKAGDGKDDEDTGSAWAGTSLQGLMDSPRKKAVPLPARALAVPVGTRAAAGFHERSPSKRAKWQTSPLDARNPKHGLKGERTAAVSTAYGKEDLGVETESEDEDDDDDDDDLDKPPRRSTSGPRGRSTTEPPPTLKLSSKKKTTSSIQPGKHPAVLEPAGIRKQAASSGEDDELGGSGLLRRMRERRSQQSLRRRTLDRAEVDGRGGWGGQGRRRREK